MKCEVKRSVMTGGRSSVESKVMTAAGYGGITALHHPTAARIVGGLQCNTTGCPILFATPIQNHSGQRGIKSIVLGFSLLYKLETKNL